MFIFKNININQVIPFKLKCYNTVLSKTIIIKYIILKHNININKLNIYDFFIIYL